MPYREELDAARSRIEALEDELARVRANREPSPATRCLVEALRAERRNQLEEIDRRVRRGRRLARWLAVVSLVGLGLWSFVLSGPGVQDLPLVYGICGIVGAVVLAFGPSLSKPARNKVSREFRLRIAEAEAQGEARSRGENDPPRAEIVTSRGARELDDEDGGTEDLASVTSRNTRDH